MAKYFIDQEFHEGFHKPLFGKRRHFIDLISIGIVDDCDREYSAISNEFDLKKVWKDNWLRENVLKPIHAELCKKESTFAKTYYYGLFQPFTLASMKTLIKWQGKTNRQIRIEVENFILAGHHQEMTDLQGGVKTIDSGGSPIEFWGYYADYDWVLFCSLFGRMIDLPTGFPMYCRDLKQELDGLYMRQENKYEGKSRLEAWLQDVKRLPNYPKQTNEHSALDDAKFNRDLYMFIQSLK